MSPIHLLAHASNSMFEPMHECCKLLHISLLILCIAPIFAQVRALRAAAQAQQEPIQRRPHVLQPVPIWAAQDLQGSRMQPCSAALFCSFDAFYMYALQISAS